MLSLTSLAGWEESVLASIAGATGTPDERDSQIERSGLYGEYPAIVNAYIEHFSNPDSALEALKRAYFLVWRSAMAAPSETGILPFRTERSASSSTSSMRGPAATRRMTSCAGCSGTTTSAVLPCSSCTARARASSVSPRAQRMMTGAAPHQPPLRCPRRGQMGRYWTSLLANSH